MIDLKRLKQLRKTNRYSCHQISNLLGFSSANAYWRMERGLSPIKAEQLQFLSELFEQPMEAFFGCGKEGDSDE